MKKNEIVTVVNDFIDLPLKNFTPSEMNLLTTFLAKCKNKGSNLVELEFSEIRSIANYTSRNNKNLTQDIIDTNTKLQDLKFAIQTDRGTLKQLVLFPTFEVDPNNNRLFIKVNEDFMYILNDLDFKYTSYEAGIHNGLTSKFSKQAFKQLRRFRSTGVWRITQEKFRELLDIPEKYRQSDIDSRVLKPILEELCPYFGDLEIEKTYKAVTRGRPSVSGYVFSWVPEKSPTEFKEQAHEGTYEPVKASPAAARRKRAVKSSYNCPYCGNPLYLKQINGEDSPAVYVHLDGWKKNALCSHIFNDVSDIRKAESVIEFGSGADNSVHTDSRTSGQGSEASIADIVKNIKPKSASASEIPEDWEEYRKKILKAVPSLNKALAKELRMLIDVYKESLKTGYGTSAAVEKINDLLMHMENTIVNAGFDKNDLYNYVFKDEDIKSFKNM